MKKRIVIKLSGQLFSMDNTKLLKEYATFFAKKSKSLQPVLVAGGGKIARHSSLMLGLRGLMNPH